MKKTLTACILAPAKPENHLCKKDYRLLTRCERQAIEIVCISRKSRKAIAHALGREGSTVIRELHRNMSTAARGLVVEQTWGLAADIRSRWPGLILEMQESFKNR